MLKLFTTADNVGGITRIVAIPVSAFRRLTFNVLTRRRSLSLTDLDGCIEIECNRNETASDSQNENNDGGITYVHQIEGRLFSLDSDRLYIIDKLLCGHWLVLACNGNGVYKLYGSVDVPLRFSFSSASGRHKIDGNTSSYLFRSVQPKPAVIIDSHPL